MFHRVRPTAFLLAHLAEFGLVGLPCVALFTATVVVLEFFRPGITASAVAPQVIAVVAAVGLVLALFATHDEGGKPRRSWPAMIGYALVSVATAGFAFWGASYYFTPVPEARGWLTAAIGGTITLLLAACAFKLPEDL